MQHQSKIDLIIKYLFVFLIISCNEPKATISCEIVQEMLRKDQFYRTKHNDLLSPYFYVLDSLVKVNGFNEGMNEFSSVDLELQSQLRARAKEIIATRPKPSQTVLDSIWKLQTAIDYENTERLINIIQEVGLSAIDTMDYECGKESLLIFVHTPDELKDEVKKVIDPDLKNISENQYNHIMWHLNGR